MSERPVCQEPGCGVRLAFRLARYCRVHAAQYRRPRPPRRPTGPQWNARAQGEGYRQAQGGRPAWVSGPDGYLASLGLPAMKERVI